MATPEIKQQQRTLDSSFPRTAVSPMVSTSPIKTLSTRTEPEPVSFDDDTEDNIIIPASIVKLNTTPDKSFTNTTVEQLSPIVSPKRHPTLDPHITQVQELMETYHKRLEGVEQRDR